MKRIFLFLATNLAIVLLLGIVMSVLGIQAHTTSGALFIAFAFGMGGSFISLAISKKMSLSATGAQIIKEPQADEERWLLATVKKQAEAANIGMPDVAVYDSPEINAFATGMSRNNALIAVSTGLVNSMSRDEVEAVLAHEISHVANGDMITLALIQGVLNTFVIFIARMVAMAIDAATTDEDGEGGLGFFGYMAVTFVLEMILGLFASMIVMWFSRKREFHADAGGGRLAGRQKMIAALESLQKNAQPSELPSQMAAFGISGSGGFTRLLMSHPPLEERIEALKNTRAY